MGWTSWKKEISYNWRVGRGIHFILSLVITSSCSANELQFKQMIFGSSEPLESYCAHFLLSRDEIYFTVLESKGHVSLYGPRPTFQVCVFITCGLCSEPCVTFDITIWSQMRWFMNIRWHLSWAKKPHCDPYNEQTVHALICLLKIFSLFVLIMNLPLFEI